MKWQIEVIGRYKSGFKCYQPSALPIPPINLKRNQAKSKWEQLVENNIDDDEMATKKPHKHTADSTSF